MALNNFKCYNIYLIKIGKVALTVAKSHLRSLIKLLDINPNFYLIFRAGTKFCYYNIMIYFVKMWWF